MSLNKVEYEDAVLGNDQELRSLGACRFRKGSEVSGNYKHYVLVLSWCTTGLQMERCIASASQLKMST